MSPNFEYFFWAIPEPDKPLYALYDLFDNHFVIQSHEYELLFKLRKLFESKTSLDIVELSGVSGVIENQLTDNSVIENWGISQVEKYLYSDITLTKKRFGPEDYYKVYVIKNPMLIETNVELDSFKQDLQKQLFFFHYCLSKMPNMSEHVWKFFLTAAELSVDFDQAINMVLDLTTIDSKDKQTREDMYKFLRMSGLFYE